MTNEFILQCEAIDLVGEAMFPGCWKGLGIKVQPGTLYMYGYDPFAEISRAADDEARHKAVRDWLRDHGFIEEKISRVKFEKAFTKAFAAESSAKRTRRHGPNPAKRNAVKKTLKADLQSGAITWAQLDGDLKQESIAKRYGVARSTMMKIIEEVRQESPTNRDKPRQTPPINN